MKVNITKKWAIAISSLITLQLSVFYTIELYLTPSHVDTFSTVATASAQEKKIQPPDGDVLYDIDKKGYTIAIYDGQKWVEIRNRDDKVLAEAELPGLHYLKWLDNGSTLFYIRKVQSRNEIGVYKVPQKKVIPLHVLPSGNVKIEKVYYASYSQIIYTIYRQDNQLYVASYESILGWKARSLAGIGLKDSWLDEKEGLLYIKDQQERIRKFTNGKFEGEKEDPAPPRVEVPQNQHLRP
ncbi:hypothetical protein [Effusibacillus lacus]|uniref:Uncharacterized protein n=1 Tax=Effusibacillus lacus TaxID=1348429 RepID=A0A292YJW2_9BACL|nr:hypothetical protein [Effusibacillus lacus]TCS69422.1 hypothetical protein EDD64_13749 [Effusibacillus lacus]GAX89189.1 hypothetical protein EFBL_0807 [Effusibacillus lacus]